MTHGDGGVNKVLITGARGQLGRALIDTVPESNTVLAAGRQELDITSAHDVQRFFVANRLSCVINTAAYTAVDKAEQEPESAAAGNTAAAANLAQACADHAIPLVHVSTDFVFDGLSGRPYTISDACNPLSVYGQSKRDGELAVLEALGDKAAIIRTAWLYSADGQNFFSTMLRLMAERDSLGVVADQTGTPTLAAGLARACWRTLQLGVTGVHHWTDAGVASWYDFAVAIQEEAVQAGILERSIPITPLTTAEFPTAAQRPANSVLDKTRTWAALALEPVHWRAQLRSAIAQRAEKLEKVRPEIC